MTCVVGVRGKNGVLLAADSQWSSENVNKMAKDPKTFELSEVLAIAYCGSGRLGQILTYHMESLESPPLGMDEHYWAVKIFIEYLRNTLYTYGHMNVANDGDAANIEFLGGSAFLLAVRGRLFSVYEDFEVLEHERIYDALGSGEPLALGAMAAKLGNDIFTPIATGRLERVAVAGIEAAIDQTNYVGGDIRFAQTVMYTDEEKKLARKILGR